MTTDLMPAEPAAPGIPDDRALRILSIATNLLPTEIVDSRRQRKVKRIILTSLVIFTLWLGGWYAEARHEASAAQNSLVASESNVQRLQRQQSAYSEVVSAEAETQAITNQLTALLAGDLQWARLMSALQTSAPQGIAVSGVFGEYKPTANAGGDATGVAAQKPIGALTVTGSGTTKAVIAEYVDALAKAPGLANPLLTDMSLLNGVLAFTIRLDITQSALGGRYTPASPSPSGVK
jgi:hypothetical protein